MSQRYVILGKGTAHPVTSQPDDDLLTVACGRRLPVDSTIASGDALTHYALCKRCAAHYQPIMLPDGGVLIASAIVKDRSSIAHLLGFQPSQVTGPHHYTPAGERIAPHLVFQHPEAFSAYHAA